ncbi:helix-turn-helix domain-containing protein [Flavobacterium bizetiae]|uniref:helix-turn-helix transcriptional regulator n=1 Tax=Flavobacterium bizetiae TaxID=2704140 RepID=UPI0021E8DD1C|nr:helix-turn-helix transcriptional regulator [Flavobacterium bizetiae]UTN04836.1 helix-turn-helix domain-containing protein [Flavobacterium bizetiae]
MLLERKTVLIMHTVVGNKLKILRKNKNMSQEEVADCLHISQSAYARMESGESHSWANHILTICKIYDITPEDLLKVDLDKGSSSNNTVNQISGEIIVQYEERIKELKKVIKDLKKDKKALKS